MGENTRISQRGIIDLYYSFITLMLERRLISLIVFIDLTQISYASFSRKIYGQSKLIFPVYAFRAMHRV